MVAGAEIVKEKAWGGPPIGPVEHTKASLGETLWVKGARAQGLVSLKSVMYILGLAQEKG